MRGNWKPSIGSGEGALYQRIVIALERDIRSGGLKSGARLPPLRELSYLLKVSVGTVTKAYLEAERRGLVTGQVGRGTFVTDVYGGRATASSETDGIVDLSLNVIPHQAAARRFAESLAAVHHRPEILAALDYAPAIGTETQRRAAAQWLLQIGNIDVPWSRIAITAGAQHAMTLAFDLLSDRADTILCESATFYGMKSLAEHRKYKLVGCKMDAEGLMPGELDKLAATTKSKVLYVMPTVQNPTARTMSIARRREIAKIVRKHKLWVVEDDNYALFRPDDPQLVPLSSLVPERSFYISGASKSIAPGLRLGFLCCPTEDTFEVVAKMVRATIYAPSSLAGTFFRQWVEDGSVFQIADSVKREISKRAAAARDILKSTISRHTPVSPHLWLPMAELEAERTANRALRAGVVLTPPTAPIICGTTTGLRICLGAAENVSVLELGLRRLQTVLSTRTEHADRGVV
jgi:DNA-binding transcriptional MocR family regulator